MTRFGLLNGGDERTQREIAKDLGISRSYVSLHDPIVTNKEGTKSH